MGSGRNKDEEVGEGMERIKKEMGDTKIGGKGNESFRRNGEPIGKGKKDVHKEVARRRNREIESEMSRECSFVGKSFNRCKKRRRTSRLHFSCFVHDGAATKEDLIAALLIKRAHCH